MVEHLRKRIKELESTERGSSHQTKALEAVWDLLYPFHEVWAIADEMLNPEFYADEEENTG